MAKIHAFGENDATNVSSEYYNNLICDLHHINVILCKLSLIIWLFYYISLLELLKMGIWFNLARPQNKQIFSYSEGFGEVAEWLKALAWKACIGLSLSRVRIPPSPPFNKKAP